VKVLLLQIDGKLPNIALMRIAAHHRALGDELELRRVPTATSIHRDLFDRYDRVYASAIFERSRPIIERVRQDDKKISWARWCSARGQPQNLGSARQLPLIGVSS